MENLHPVDDEGWRQWTLSLLSARGPQPLAAFERLAVQNYFPLVAAIANGLDDPHARKARDEFRTTFARAYHDAFPTFAVTGKRPRMVMDVFDLAGQTARLHGARATHLVLVDSLRWDLGATVRDLLKRLLGERASLTHEWLLWSALPTVTKRQIDAMTVGLPMLEPWANTDENEVARGRTAEVIRRIKVGARDVYKLDIVETRVREAGVKVLPGLPEIASSAASIIARHAFTLPARTLLVVFGDHGFALTDEGIAVQGGASPEEALVPAFTFLLGEVH